MILLYFMWNVIKKKISYIHVCLWWGGVGVSVGARQQSSESLCWKFQRRRQCNKIKKKSGND